MSLLNYGFTKTKSEDSSNSSDDVVFIENVVSPKSSNPVSSKIITVSKLNTSLEGSASDKRGDLENNIPKSAKKKSVSKLTNERDSPKSSKESPKLSKEKQSPMSTKEKSTKNVKEKVSPKKDKESPKKVVSKVLNKPTKVLSSPSQASNIKNSTPKIPKMFSQKQTESSPKTKSNVDISFNDSSPRKSYENCLPAQRIKMIMKSCPDVEIVPQESLHIVTRATELFVQHLASKSVLSSGKLDYECLSNHVHSDNSLEFLKETIPKKITWAECQKLIAESKKKEVDFI